MAIRWSGRAVLAEGTANLVCIVPIQLVESQTIGISYMTCCVKNIEPCIVQGDDKTFTFQDATTVDYSGATEIDVTVWNGASTLYNATLTGGGVTLINDYSFSITITDTQSDDFPRGYHPIEIRVTMAGGEKRTVGMGRLRVIDSLRHAG